MKGFLRDNLVILRAMICLCMTMSLQGMLYRTTSQAARKVPARSTSLIKYQKAAATQKLLKQRAQIHQQRGESIKAQDIPKVEPLQPRSEPPYENQERFNFGKSAVSKKGGWGALLAGLGLGWLWYNSEAEEKEKRKSETNGKPITLEQFVKKFVPPKEVQETIEKHKDSLVPCSVKPYLIKGTYPPIYHKCWGIDRIMNAEMLKEVIKQNSLDIEIPNKYIYPNPNNGKYEMFVEGVQVQPLGDKPLTLKEAQQLTTLTIESGYTDLNKNNVFRNPINNKLVIIDTEDMSFHAEATKMACVELLMRRFNHHNLKVSKDARVWVEDYLKKLKESEEGREFVDLYTSKRYNKLNISPENAKKLHRELWKQNREQDGFAARIFRFMKNAVRPLTQTKPKQEFNVEAYEMMKPSTVDHVPSRIKQSDKRP